MPFSPGSGSIEDAVDQPAEIPAGRVDELQSVDVGRVVVEHDGQLDDDLFACRDDDVEVAELPGQAPQRIRERVVRVFDERRAAAFPADGVAHIGELRGRFVQVVDDGDAVQLVERALVTDDRARDRIPHHRHLVRIGEWHADRGRGLAGRVLLVDLLDRDEQVLALRLEIGRDRAVREPEPVVVDMVVVARHLAGEVDVVEDDQVRLRIRVSRIGVEIDVGVERVGLRVVLDPAVLVDIQLDRRRRCRQRRRARRRESRSSHPRAPNGRRPAAIRTASSQLTVRLPRLFALCAPLEVICVLVPRTGRSDRERNRGSPSCGLDCGGPAVMGPWAR